MAGVNHEQAYASLAYVSWTIAVAGELVLGEQFAQRPTRMPATVPWA